MPTIDVNTTELIKFSKKLDKMSRRALPLAVKRTLNSVAFETKKKTLPQEARKSFPDQRSPSFYKRFSRAQMVKGNKINTMESKAGMFDDGRAKSDQAVQDQTQQQLGGVIKGRTLIPMDQARVGGKHSRNVKKKNRISNLNIVLDTKDSDGATPQKRLIQTAIQAVKKFGPGSVIKHKGTKREIIYRVERGREIKTREFNLKLIPLYTVQDGRTVRITKPKPFTLIAGLRAQKQANKFFRTHAKKALNQIR